MGIASANQIAGRDETKQHFRQTDSASPIGVFDFCRCPALCHGFPIAVGEAMAAGGQTSDDGLVVRSLT
jgi:hypothetical protein